MDNLPVDNNLAIWTVKLYPEEPLSLGDNISSLKIASVSSGYCNKNTTGGGLTNTHSLLTVLEIGSPRSRSKVE